MSIHFVPFSCTVNLCEMYEVNFPPWTEATNAAICSLLRKYDSPLHALHHKSIYFFRKTKMADNHLCFFCCMLLGCSLFAQTVLPTRILNSRPSRCLGNLAAIQQRPHEDLAYNHFKVLFIYTVQVLPILTTCDSRRCLEFGGSSAMGA